MCYCTRNLMIAHQHVLKPYLYARGKNHVLKLENPKHVREKERCIRWEGLALTKAGYRPIHMMKPGIGGWGKTRGQFLGEIEGFADSSFFFRFIWFVQSLSISRIVSQKEVQLITRNPSPMRDKILWATEITTDLRKSKWNFRCQNLPFNCWFPEEYQTFIIFHPLVSILRRCGKLWRCRGYGEHTIFHSIAFGSRWVGNLEQKWDHK